MDQLVIFDGDDTLWYVEALYDAARRAVASVVSEEGLSGEVWDHIQRRIDLKNLETMGLGRERFPTSSVEAYEQLASSSGVRPRPSTAERIRMVAMSPFRTQAELEPIARSVVSELRGFASVALLTQGDAIVQEKRIRDANLEDLFDEIRIVDRKSEADFFALMHRFGTEASDSWSVGNSVASDIHPALRLGMNCIWIDAHTWEYERREMLEHPDDGVTIAHSLGDIVDIIGTRCRVRN